MEGWREKLKADGKKIHSKREAKQETTEAANRTDGKGCIPVEPEMKNSATRLGRLATQLSKRRHRQSNDSTSSA